MKTVIIDIYFFGLQSGKSSKSPEASDILNRFSQEAWEDQAFLFFFLTPHSSTSCETSPRAQKVYYSKENVSPPETGFSCLCPVLIASSWTTVRVHTSSLKNFVGHHGYAIGRGLLKGQETKVGMNIF